MQKNISKRFLYGPSFDTVFFFMPFFLALSFAYGSTYLFPGIIESTFSLMWFFIFTIIFDVGHVWGTLFRAYFHTKNFLLHRRFLIAIPIFAFFILLLTGWISLQVGKEVYVLPVYILAWFAVFHFIKQHIGIMLLYMKKEIHEKRIHKYIRITDTAMIWVVTGIPMLYWWTNYDMITFEWFEEGEFALFATILPNFPFLGVLYFIVVMLYISLQMMLFKFSNELNPLKYLYLIGVALVWYTGIIHYNSAIIFGFGNIIVHGMNYYGIVLGSTIAQKGSYSGFFQKFIFKYIFLTIPLILIFLGFLEEFLWDQFVWNERPSIFGEYFYNFVTSQVILGIIIAMLGSIQLTHYILDRYIWRKDYGEIV